MTSEIDKTHVEPIAVVQGQLLLTLPNDLYIPPDALRVFLEAFEGPLDLLLYLIKKQNLDILNIPMAELTQQYIEYVEFMQDLRFELAAEYLLMAAMLVEIKSRMLLPKPVLDQEEEEDPRTELIKRLQEYERFKKAAEDLDALPREGRDFHKVEIAQPEMAHNLPPPAVTLMDLFSALQDIIERSTQITTHQVRRELLSVRERMSHILSCLSTDYFIDFNQFCIKQEGRLGIVVTFLATLELLKQAMIELVQNAPFSRIHLRAKVKEQLD